MILVDTSIRVDHLRAGEAGLTRLLNVGLVLGHAWVAGEVATGQLARRAEVLGLLANLPQARIASDPEVMTLVETRRLHGRGIGFVDAQLLASTLLASGAPLWTRHKRLAATSSALGLAPGPH